MNPLLQHVNPDGLLTTVEPCIELRGRSRRSDNGDRFRTYVLCYSIPEGRQIRLLDRALQRNTKVRTISKSYYGDALDRPEIKSWVNSAIETIESILPSLSPLRLPTHFLIAGFTIEGEDLAFFKIFMNLEKGFLSPDKCAEKISWIVFHWGDSHEKIKLDAEQNWVLDCISSQWRLLRD